MLQTPKGTLKEDKTAAVAMITNSCTSATVFVLLILAVCVTLASTPIVHVHQASIHTKATASLCSQTGLKQNANDADAYWDSPYSSGDCNASLLEFESKCQTEVLSTTNLKSCECRWEKYFANKTSCRFFRETALNRLLDP